jgi:hypothetical protein
VTDEAQKLIDAAVGLRKRALTPEQAERREAVQRRNEAIQRGVRPPASGVFSRGLPPKS